MAPDAAEADAVEQHSTRASGQYNHGRFQSAAASYAKAAAAAEVAALAAGRSDCLVVATLQARAPAAAAGSQRPEKHPHLAGDARRLAPPRCDA